MTTLLIVLLVYFIGGILSFGRMLGSTYQMDEESTFFPSTPPTEIKFEYWISLLSWIGFLIGVFCYFKFDDKYFFKWDKCDLWDQHFISRSNF
jgi:hypothetical protein